MRSRKRLVQIQVHHVDAKIAGPRHSGERVHVRAVHVQQRALRVQNLRDLRNSFFENPQRRWIGDHQRRDIFGDEFAQFIDVDLPVRFRLDVLHFVAGDHRSGGICAVRRIGNQNLLARIALLFEIGANQQQARQFALRARRRLQRDRVHAGNFQQALFEQPQDLQAALRKLQRLSGMFGGDAL